MTLKYFCCRLASIRVVLFRLKQGQSGREYERPLGRERRETMEKVKVLVVDDEIQVGEMMACFSREILGGECKIAGCAEDGISVIADGFVPDVVISDFLMPGMDGIEFFRALKEAGYDGKWLFVTGTPDHRLRDFAFENDLEILIKPFAMATFAYTIKWLTER